MTQNDEAWKKIFENLPLLTDIEREGFVLVSADDLKREGGREPRLLAKLDTKSSRPEIFKQYNLSILPVTNGNYVIFRDDLTRTYFPISRLMSTIVPEEYDPVQNYSEYQTLSLGNITSESQAIDFASLVSLLKTFTDETELFLTIRGRQRSKPFDVRIPSRDLPFRVSGVQIEIDAGFESPDKVYIIEAKLSRIEDFNIRQLDYPYEDWSRRTSKTVIPIFFIYTNGLFYFLQFEFGGEYGALQYIRGKCYTVNEPVKQRINLERFLRLARIGPEPDVTYPQANDLDKVIDIITNFYSANLTNKSVIAEFFDFDERQGDYYADAAIFLGLLKRHPDRHSEFELTHEGEIISSSLNRSQRNLFLLTQMLKIPSFNAIFQQFRSNDFDISQMNLQMISQIIQQHCERINASTPRRRASTVRSWLKWMKNNMDFE